MKKLTLILLPALLSGCICIPPTHTPRIHHIVLCWLKDSGNVAQREKIIETSRAFTEMPGVIDVRTGQVIMSQRDIVDDSFDVAITMTFATEEDMNSYISHPLHKQAVKETLLPLVSRIIVYDFAE